MLGHIDIKKRKLFAETPAGTQIMASAVRNFKGEFRWNSRIWGRSGRKDYQTVKECLQTAAKSLGVTVCEIR